MSIAERGGKFWLACRTAVDESAAGDQPGAGFDVSQFSTDEMVVEDLEFIIEQFGLPSLLDPQRWTVFLDSLDEVTSTDDHFQGVGCVDAFEGISISAGFLPNEGYRFVSGRTYPVVAFDREGWDWLGKRPAKSDLSWAGAKPFFRTYTGNCFVLRPDGVVGKWTHDDDPKFAEVFSSLEQFGIEFCKYFDRPVSDMLSRDESPFTY
ncbi:MAG: hypothetical protein U0795_18055 [Pirellulales bacterium]